VKAIKRYLKDNMFYKILNENGLLIITHRGICYKIIFRDKHGSEYIKNKTGVFGRLYLKENQVWR
jgi:hypothetical protein